MIKTLRPAIAMIELIFSIVIMGIVMMSAPMLISTSTQSTYVSLQQEGINEAASRVHMIMGYAWDENNTNIGDEYVPPILFTSSTVADLDVIGTTKRRVGIPLLSKRSYIAEDNASTQLYASSNLGNDGGDSDDIDDYIGTTTVNPIEAASIDYIEKQGQLSIDTNITYGGDDTVAGGYALETITFVPFSSATTATSNVKNITVTLTSTSGVSDLTKNIVLRAFSCNIGGYELEERVF